MKDKFWNIRGKTLHMTFIKVNGLHRRRAKKHFERLELSHGQPKILDFLVANDGCIQREIAKHCCIEAATVTSLLGIMEKSGLIERQQNPQDRRVLNVFLTDKGRERQASIGKVFNELDEECLQGFSLEEREQLISYLERIYNNMKGREEEDA